MLFRSEFEELSVWRLVTLLGRLESACRLPVQPERKEKCRSKLRGKNCSWALENLDKAVEARKEMVQQGEACNEVVKKLLDDLKMMMGSNLDLARQVGNL